MSLEIVGKFVQKLDEQSGQGKNGVWRKQEFVIETGDQYPKKICIALWGDRIQMLEGLEPGASLKVAFDVESREYNGRWYTDVKAWRIEALSADSNTSNDSSAQAAPEDDPFPDTMLNSDAEDDLPF